MHENKNAPSDLISIHCVLFVLDVSKKWLVSSSWVHLFFLSILHQIYTPQPPIQYTVRFLKAWRPKNQWQWGKIPHIEAKIFMNMQLNFYTFRLNLGLYRTSLPVQKSGKLSKSGPSRKPDFFLPGIWILKLLKIKNNKKKSQILFLTVYSFKEKFQLYELHWNSVVWYKMLKM